MNELTINFLCSLYTAVYLKFVFRFEIQYILRSTKLMVFYIMLLIVMRNTLPLFPICMLVHMLQKFF